jgi:hypothetical protein
MSESNRKIFMLSGEVFKYHEGNLYISTDGQWNVHASYLTYGLAYEEAKEIVAEYYAMGQGEVSCQSETYIRYVIKYPNRRISRQHWASYETAAAFLSEHQSDSMRIGAKVIKLVEEV